MHTNFLRAYVILREFIYSKFRVQRELEYCKNNIDAILKQGENAYKCRTESFGIEEKLDFTRSDSPEREITILGELDHDGYLLAHTGHIRNFRMVNEEDFSPRTRNQLHVVDIKGYAGVRKNFHRNTWSFVNEIKAFHILSLAGANVPAILDVDLGTNILTTSYVLGINLQDALADKGAIVRYHDIQDHPDYKDLRKKEIINKFDNSGKCFVYDAVDESFVNQIVEQVEIVHSCGIIWSDVKYGNIIIERETGMPYLLDFEHSRFYPELSKSNFSKLCERDNSLVRSLFCIE